jgi:hypothetical protein
VIATLLADQIPNARVSVAALERSDSVAGTDMFSPSAQTRLKQICHKKAQELSVLPAADFRAPIGALPAAFALRFFVPFCGQTLGLVSPAPRSVFVDQGECIV